MHNHPFFKTLGATYEDLDICFREKFLAAFLERPLQQIIVHDTEKNNKIVGVYLVQNFINLPEV